MRPGEVASISYLSPSNSPSFRAHYNMHQGNIKTANFSCLFGPHFTEHLQTTPVVHGMNVPIACLTNSAISDKPGGDKLIQAEERRKRRMISNRESARRSRMRKQKHIGELYSQVIRLRSVNHQLLNELNHVMGEHDQIIEENSLLKNEETELQMKLKGLPAKFACSQEGTEIS